jgi:PST family polysaccharide transporter
MLVLLTKVIDNNFVDHRLLILTSWILFYDLFFPTWYFQGIEKMGFITMLSLISKSIFFISVFVFIKSSSDFLLFPIIQMVGSVLTGICAYYIIFKIHDLKIIKPEFKKMKKYFYESTHIFFSNIFQTIFINTNKIIIGKFLGMSQVTYYDLAEKIYSLSKIPQVISGQVIFPKISKDRDLKFVFKFLKYLLVFNLIIIIVCFIFSSYISQIFLGSEVALAISAINLMVLMLPLSSVHNIFGVQVLISFGFSKIYTRIIFFSLVFYALIILNLGYFDIINLISLIFSLIITEIFISIFLIYEYRKKIKK